MNNQGFDIPLADRLRPETLDDVAGQRHILGEGKILRKIIESGRIPNMIFYGPAGTGKTTVANIAAKASGRTLYKLNATSASVKDIKDIINDCDSLIGQNGILLYLDEIQNFNKKQQQSLLEYTENCKITLIASTTENPYFYVYNAILSRSTVFEFKQLGADDIEGVLRRALGVLSSDYLGGAKVSADENALRHISQMADGDVRRAVTALEMAVLYSDANEDGSVCVTLETAEQCTQKKAFKYDKSGDSHYDIISALQKSIRGSDPNAAVHYLARLVAADDLQIICRRLLVTAAEDVGLAYPMAIPIVKACVDSALQLGFPEARIPLADAVVLLATAPKSNSAYKAIGTAMADLESKDTGEIPRNLQNKHYDGSGNEKVGQNYLYPHSYPNHYVEQQYLPDNIKDAVYYVAGENKNERAAAEYWRKIKSGGENSK